METAGSSLPQPQTVIWGRDLAFAQASSSFSSIPLTWGRVKRCHHTKHQQLHSKVGEERGQKTLPPPP